MVPSAFFPFAPMARLNNLLSVSFSLLILTLMNVGLFYKLWAMEDIAHRMYLSTKHRLRERNEARLDNVHSLRNMHIWVFSLGLMFIKGSNDNGRNCHDHSQSRCLGVGGIRRGSAFLHLFVCPHTREPLFYWLTMLKVPVYNHHWMWLYKWHSLAAARLQS